MRDVQVDAKAFMATLETTDEPLEICNSCLRAHLYAAMAYAGGVQSSLDQVVTAVPGLAPALLSANSYMQALLQALTQLCRVDFLGSMPGAEELSEEDWAIAIASFYQARIEHYVDEKTGQIRFEPHNHDDEDPDDGVPA